MTRTAPPLAVIPRLAAFALAFALLARAGLVLAAEELPRSLPGAGATADSSGATPRTPASPPSRLSPAAGPPPLTFATTTAYAGAIGLAFALDDPVGTNYRDRGLSFAVERSGEFLSDAPFLVSAFGAIALDGWVLHHPGSQTAAKDLVFCVGATTVVVEALKVMTQRERPNGVDRYSFPSGHASATFAAATAIEQQYGARLGWVAYAAAATVGYSRIADNEHHFSDVVAGAVVGHVVSRSVLRRLHRASAG